MKRVSILEQVKKNNNLLSLPQVLSEVLEEVSKDNYSADSLAKIILKDPSLTSRILRMANSSFYKRFSEIKTVHQAISIMGVTTVKCLALSSSIFHPEKIARESNVDPREFFIYVLSVATGCKKIAQAISFTSSEEAFIAGLLNDVGLMFFLHYYPDKYKKIISKEIKADSLIDAEREVFGIDHTEVGYYMAETWRLPDEIRDAIGNHHNVNANGNEKVLQYIVRLSVLLAKDRFSGYEIRLEDRLNRIGEISKRLSITKQQVDEISSSLLLETFEFAEYLGVDIGDIEEMLSNANKEIWKTYLIIENLFKERQELSKSLLEEERDRGAMESKNIALATLSHYLNNAVMAIYGRSQILQMMLRKGQTTKILEQLPESLEKIERSIKKIVAVLEEMKEVSPIDHKKFDSMSRAMNIDDLIEARLAKLNKDLNWEKSLLSSP